jgi:hypothetical protein
MERKSRENLEAARLLLGLIEPCTNAGTSRAYYAAYLACWLAMVDRGTLVPMTPRGRYFSHKDLPGQARDCGLLSEDQADDLAFLETQRVLADYSEEDVTHEVSHQCLQLACYLVDHLLGDEDAP